MNIKIRNLFVNLVLVALLLAPSLCLANPEGGVVSAGEATISESGSNLTINQASDKAVIDWRSFDIAPTEATKFNQPSPESVTLNRIHSDNASTIAGKLTANGNVVLVNQNGFLFTKDAVVDVNSIIATTSDIDNNDFMNGKMEFTKPGNPEAMIINEGKITAKQAGLVGLVAPQVINNGHIVANGGRVQLSSGDTFTVDLYGDKLIEVAVSDKLKKQLVKNKGLIEAKGGKIILTAAAGKEIVDSLIVVEGELKAPAVLEKNGEIYIYAEGSNAVPKNITANKAKKLGSSRVEVAARIDTSGRNARERGGKIIILADDVTIKSESIIDASGFDGLVDTTEGLEVFAERIESAGGDIRIGGDYKGSGNTPTASKLIVEKGAEIYSDSINSGDAGRNIFWADGETLYYGRSYSRALGVKGNGGFIETSGKNSFVYKGTIDPSTKNGKPGTWLLDPANMTITGADANLTNGINSPFLSNGAGDATVNVTDIQTLLNGNSNVIVSTGADGFGSSGDITVSSAITSTGTGNLTLSAYRNITVNSAINLAGGTLTLTSDNASNNSGVISITANITTNGGDITMTGGTGYAIGYAGNVTGISSTGLISSGAGTITMNGKGIAGGYGVSFNKSITTTTGTLNITGVSAGLAGVNQIYTATNIITSTNGNINITGNSSGSNGVNILDKLTTANGTVTLYGKTTFAGAVGLSLFPGAGGCYIRATGTGSLDLTGISTTGRAIYTNNLLQITTNSGTIDIVATSTSAGNTAFWLNGSTVATTGVGSQINITATTGGFLPLNLTAGGGGGTINSGTSTTTITGSSAGSTDITISSTVLTSAGTTTLQSNCVNSIGLCGTISLPSAFTLPGNVIINAGTATGTVSIANTVNGAKNLTITGGTVTLAGIVGGVTPLSNLSITSNNSITLPKISAASVFVQTNSATANIALSGNITTTGATPVNATYGTLLYTGNDFNSNAFSISTGAKYFGIYINDTVQANSTTAPLVGTTYTGCSYNAGNPSCLSGAVLNTVNAFFYTIGSSITVSTNATTAGLVSYNAGTATYTSVSGVGNINVAELIGYLATNNVSIIGGVDPLASNGDVTILAPVTNPAATNLTISSYRDINVNSAITHAGGAINLYSDNASNSSGAINISANITSGGGNILMAGGPAGASYAYARASGLGGVNNNAITIDATNGAGGGNITMKGNGYNAAVNDACGVLLNGFAAITKTSGTGNISIIGQAGGGAGSSTSFGVNCNGCTVEVLAGGAATGSVTMTGNGSGAATGASNLGINFNIPTIATVSGSITLTGTASNSGSGADHGIYAFSGGIATTGGGAINITGTAGTATNSASGIAFNTSITGSGGDITLIGNGGGSTGTGSSNYGINIQGAVTNTGNGKIIATGTGGGTAGGTTNDGIYISSGGIFTVNGLINLTGTGGLGSSNDRGIYGTGGSITTSGTGTIALAGTGGGSGGINHGVQLTGTTINSAGNATTITGQYGFGGDDIYVNQNIATTGTTTLQSNCAPCGIIEIANANTLAGPMVINAGASGTAKFDNTIDGNFTLNATAATITLGGNIGTGTKLSSVTLLQKVGALSLSPYNIQTQGAGGLSVTTNSGNMLLGGTYSASAGPVSLLPSTSAIVLSAATTVSSSTIASLGGTVNGAFPLSISAATITPNGAWGGVINLGNITFSSAFTLGNNLTLTSLGTTNITSTVNGAKNLIINSNAITQGAAIGGGVALTSATLNSTTAMSLPHNISVTGALLAETTAGNITTSANYTSSAGSVTIFPAGVSSMILAADTTINAPSITIATAIDGTVNL